MMPFLLLLPLACDGPRPSADTDDSQPVSYDAAASAACLSEKLVISSESVPYTLSDFYEDDAADRAGRQVTPFEDPENWTAPCGGDTLLHPNPDEWVLMAGGSPYWVDESGSSEYGGWLCLPRADVEAWRDRLVCPECVSCVLYDSKDSWMVCRWACGLPG